MVLNDFQRGKLPYYVKPPGCTESENQEGKKEEEVKEDKAENKEEGEEKEIKDDKEEKKEEVKEEPRKRKREEKTSKRFDLNQSNRSKKNSKKLKKK
jgi:nuclear GTP-binding protein